MIFVGGGGFGLLAFLAVVLLLFTGGDVLPLLVLLAFVAVPFLALRSVLRRPRRASFPPPEAAWQAPTEPVLPSVSVADVTSLRDRLAHDVRTLDPGEDPVARQALADAAERHSTASTLLDRATSDAQLRTAWLAAVEGLSAAQTVRRRLGLDPGPPLPTLPSAGPQLTGPAQIEVDGQRRVGGPSYEPGRPHWFPGGYHRGRQLPGGWYDAPFWPSALLLGGLAGWTLGGLAGPVYAEDLDAGGAGWDGGGDGSYDGGDWGGGFGGGGDWGGGDLGGGDFGGGDFGGGGDW